METQGDSLTSRTEAAATPAIGRLVQTAALLLPAGRAVRIKKTLRTVALKSAAVVTAFLVSAAIFIAAGVWKTLRSIVRKPVTAMTSIVGAAILVLVGKLLVNVLTSRATTIAPLVVPQAIEHSGTTPIVAAQRLRDELRKFAEHANTPLQGLQLALSEDLPDFVVPRLGLSVDDDLPDFEVPAVGLSLETIAGSLRTFFRLPHRRNISGEMTLLDNKLWLRLRLNGRVFYDSPSVDPKDMDQLFSMAVNKIFQITEPYLSAAALAHDSPLRAIEAARLIISDCPTSETRVDCPDPQRRQAARSYNLIGAILHSKYHLEEAMIQYRKATAIDSSFAIAHSNLAGAFVRRVGSTTPSQNIVKRSTRILTLRRPMPIWRAPCSPKAGGTMPRLNGVPRWRNIAGRSGPIRAL